MRLNGKLIQIMVLCFTLLGLIGAAAYTSVRHRNDSYADFLTHLPETRQLLDQTVRANIARSTERSVEYTQQAVSEATELALLALTPEYARTPIPTTSDPLLLTATEIVRYATQRAIDITRAIRLTVVAHTPVPDMDVFSTQQACSWREAFTSLSDIALQFEVEIYKNALIPELQSIPFVSISTSGEECVDAEGNIQGFVPMRTRFTISFGLDPDTEDALKENLAAGILEILPLFPEESLPGQEAGEVEIKFVSFDNGYIVQTLQFSYEQGIDVLNQGLTGEDVIEALGGFETEEF